MDTEPGITQLGRRCLDLDGWSELSVWGWDDQTGSLFAQLWHDRPYADEDDRDDERPEIWIAPPTWDATDQPVILARRIAEATGAPTATVLRAMALPPPGQSG